MKETNYSSGVNEENQRVLQLRIGRILDKVLHREDQTGELRDAIEDLLVSGYDWKDATFGYPIGAEGFKKLVEDIRNLQHKKINEDEASGNVAVNSVV